MSGNPLAAVVSLGCVKNLVDSETLTSQLVNLGYDLTTDPSRASIVVVNTCGFLESAVSEAVETILELSRHKTSGTCRRLVVTGCMVQRYGKKLPNLLPEVDLFLGTSHYHELGKALRALETEDSRRLWISRPKHLIAGGGTRLRSTPFYSAYLKIAEGCGNRCSFCMIPSLRGPYRSRAIDDIIEEASILSREGVIEINLIAQDITAFGSDRGDAGALVRLLETIEQLDGIRWVRLLYAHPSRIHKPLLRVMSQSKKIVPYLDIPVQHCVPGILRAMHREESIPDPQGIVDAIRSSVPGIALRTSLIAGFPGETESDFHDLIEFVERNQFEHLGVFAFSPEIGTRAARLDGQIEDSTKEERRGILLDIQRNISRSLLERLIGRTIPVLIEGPHPETDLLLAGRLPSQAPEVDGTVIITRGEGHTGTIMHCRITAAHDYDVEAELLESDGIFATSADFGTNPSAPDPRSVDK